MDINIDIPTNEGESFKEIQVEQAPKTIISKALIEKFDLIIDATPVVLSEREAITLYAWPEILEGAEVYLSNGLNNKLNENNMVTVYIKLFSNWRILKASQEFLLDIPSREAAQEFLAVALSDKP